MSLESAADLNNERVVGAKHDTACEFVIFAVHFGRWTRSMEKVN